MANGEFYDNGFDELNDFLAMEAGRIAMQETIMQFLVKFCGYTPAESDNVRRAIAKKKGTEKLLPEIEQRFIEYSSNHYDISVEECAKVIKPFIQVILDASAYAFSWNHSDSYSLIGYICGYLRYYHPLEFLTASLNVFGDNTEKTSAIIKYANKVGVRITPPRFGLSKSDYFFTKDKNIIAKGLSSVKYMSKAIANELYELSKNNTYSTFTDLLADIYGKTSVNSRQLDILIKIDFFSDFGNQRELMKICDIFEMLLKARNFNDIMGYAGYISGREEDRNKLYIKDVYPVRRKKDNAVFGYSVITQSIGNGKESRMTVFKRKFDEEPIHAGDIVVCKSWERDGKYFRMLNYEHLLF